MKIGMVYMDIYDYIMIILSRKLLYFSIFIKTYKFVHKFDYEKSTINVIFCLDV